MKLLMIMISVNLRNQCDVYHVEKWHVNLWHISSDMLQRRLNVTPVEHLQMYERKKWDSFEVRQNSNRTVSSSGK